MNIGLAFLPTWPTLLVFAITAVALVRTMFWFFDDPEGPNLLIVTVLAGVVYLASLQVYRLNASTAIKFWLTVIAQVVIAVMLYILFTVL